MTKKLFRLASALLLICLLAGCGSPLAPLGSVTAIEILPAVGDYVMVTDAGQVTAICDNLGSLKLVKMEYNEPTVLLYTLRFYDEGGVIVENLRISIDGWIDIDGYFHYVSEGALDLTQIEEAIG